MIVSYRLYGMFGKEHGWYVMVNRCKERRENNHNKRNNSKWGNASILGQLWP